MNRSSIYDQEPPRPFDFQWQWRDILAAIGGLELDLSGQNTTVAAGLAATATSPASMTVNIGAGRIYQQAAMDATQWGSLPSDNTVVQQQGYNPGQAINLTTGALSAGQSQWALIQATFAQVDQVRPGDPTGGLLYYYNTDNPSQPFQGPGGDGEVQDTERLAYIEINVVYGSPATTGSEVPPNATAGFIPLYLIDLTFGQSTIIQGDILTSGPSVGTGVPNNYPYAPFIAGLLNQHHLGITGQAPQIDLTAEVKNTLPLARLPASSTSGGGIGVFKLNAGNPNMAVAGNANVNAASDMCYDYTNNILYVCTSTGTTSTAVWSPTSGAATSYAGTVPATGSANALVVAAVIPASFTLQTGYQVTVVPNTANSGSTTLNVASTGVKTIQKLSGGSLVNLSGGELAGGTPATVTYNGTVWVLGAGAFGTIAYLNVGNGLRNDGSGNLQTDMAFASDSAGTVAVTAAMQATQRVAAGAVSYTLPTSTGKWSGFGFQFFALGGAVTFTLATGTDAINGGAAGASLVVPQGYAGEVYTDANGNYYVQWAPSNIGTVASSAGALGLSAFNDTGTPSTKIDISADSVVMQNSSGGAIRATSVSVVIDITTGHSSSTANGMDGESPPQPGWLYFFLISNGATVSGLASTSRTAPTLPSGYTYAFYAGAARVNSSGNVLSFLQRGRRTQYVLGGANLSVLPVLFSGSVGTVNLVSPIYAAVSISNLVPPSASKIAIVIQSIASSGQSYCMVAPNNSYGGPQSTTAGLGPPVSGSAVFTACGGYGEIVLESSNVYVSSSVEGAGSVLAWEDFHVAA